jgi:hypothetical protein
VKACCRAGVSFQGKVSAGDASFNAVAEADEHPDVRRPGDRSDHDLPDGIRPLRPSFGMLRPGMKLHSDLMVVVSMCDDRAGDLVANPGQRKATAGWHDDDLGQSDGLGMFCDAEKHPERLATDNLSRDPRTNGQRLNRLLPDPLRDAFAISIGAGAPVWP